jgi:hypothetical protein
MNAYVLSGEQLKKLQVRSFVHRALNVISGETALGKAISL